MNISMSVRIIPNRCDDCWYCRPSNNKSEFVMFCIKRNLHKKNYRRCALWISADKSREDDKRWLHAVGIKDIVEAFQRGRMNERYRIIKQVKP